MKWIIIVFISVLFSDCKCQDLLPFRADSLWGFKDRQGIIQITPQYQYATKFSYDVAIVAKNGSFGAIDQNNELIIPHRYQFLEPLDASEFLFGFRARYFGEYFMGVMTIGEKIKIPAEYNYITKHKGFYKVKKNVDSVMAKSSGGDVRSIRSYYGLYDKEFNLIIPCKYDYLTWMNDNLIDVTKGTEGINHAIFNSKGEQLTGFEYMVFGAFVEDLAKVRIGNKYGFIDLQGKIAIPVRFDYCEDFSDGYAMIKEKEKWGAINKNGKIVIETNFDYQQVRTMLKEKLVK